MSLMNFCGKLLVLFLVTGLSVSQIFSETVPATPAPVAATPAVTPPADKGEKTEPPANADKDAKAAKRKKKAIKLADDKEEAIKLEKDPATFELSNRKMLDDYGELDRHPYDRGEHILISALFGAFGGGVVGGMIGFSGFDKNDTTKSTNSLYAFGGAGAGVGALSGIIVTFFERKNIEQFAIGKFLLKYSWYGAFGGALIGAGIGLLPYASSGDYGDIARYGGYGAGVGLAAGLAFFFIDLPDHIKLFSYKRDDQGVIVLALRF